MFVLSDYVPLNPINIQTFLTILLFDNKSNCNCRSKESLYYYVSHIMTIINVILLWSRRNIAPDVEAVKFKEELYLNNIVGATLLINLKIYSSNSKLLQNLKIRKQYILRNQISYARDTCDCHCCSISYKPVLHNHRDSQIQSLGYVTAR